MLPVSGQPHGSTARVRQPVHRRQAGDLQLPWLPVADSQTGLSLSQSRASARTRLQGEGQHQHPLSDAVACDCAQEVTALERPIPRVDEPSLVQFGMHGFDRGEYGIFARQATSFLETGFQVGIRPLGKQRRIFEQLRNDLTASFGGAPQLAFDEHESAGRGPRAMEGIRSGSAARLAEASLVLSHGRPATLPKREL
jgi:hypothetical protein